jgi:hypothetical protein
MLLLPLLLLLAVVASRRLVSLPTHSTTPASPHQDSWGGSWLTAFSITCGSSSSRKYVKPAGTVQQVVHRPERSEPSMSRT